MLKLIIKRIIYAVPVLFGITVLSFAIIQLSPGDYFDQLELNPEISRETIESLRAQFGYNQPVLTRYLLWVKGIFTLDLGMSLAYKIPVSKLVLSRLLPTLALSVTSIVFIWIFSIPLGFFCAVKHNRLADRIISTFMFAFMSLPSFFVAFVFVYLSYYLPGMPSGGMASVNYESMTAAAKAADLAKHLAVPVAVVLIASIGPIVRIIKSNALEIMGSDFITATRARGLSERSIIFRHLLKNALNPLLTILGYQLSGLLSGVALTEAVLSWPGLGSLVLESVLKQDTQVVMASLFTGAVMLLIGNLISDILLQAVDPRIKIT